MTTTESFRIEIAPQGWHFECAPDQTLLMAALDAGIQLPSSCRNGTCRTCITRVKQGRARHTIKWPGLSMEEKREGWILPCVACAEGPLTIEQPLALQLFGPD